MLCADDESNAFRTDEAQQADADALNLDAECDPETSYFAMHCHGIVIALFHVWATTMGDQNTTNLHDDNDNGIHLLATERSPSAGRCRSGGGS